MGGLRSGLSDEMASDAAAPSVWALVEHRAALTPDATMLVDEHRRSLTFEQFRLAASETAAGLGATGVVPGSTVSWQLPSTIEAAVLMAALARLSATQNPILPVLRRREVLFMVKQTGSSTFIVPRAIKGFDHGALAGELAAELPVSPIVLDGIRRGPFDLALPRAAVDGLAEHRADEGDHVRWLYYTSGTTADPKGVRHTDRTVMASSNALVLVGQLGPDDVVCAPIPFSHIGGMMIIAACLRSGCRLVLFEGFDPVSTPELAAEQGTTVLGAVPVMMGAFFAAQRALGPVSLLPRLRFVFSGGAPVPSSLHPRVRIELGGLGVVSTWGLTEGPQVTFPPLDAGDTKMMTTTGPPVPGVEVRVTDADGHPCLSGIEGELRVKGPQLFVGYVDSSLDRDALDADGFLRTGDFGSIDDEGFVRVTGRLKDVIIRNGENISAQEVEQLLQTHPAIVDATAVGIADDRTGERVCAVVVLDVDVPTLSVADLRGHFESEGVARHKFPESLVIVDVIPRNDLGKARKAAVRALVESRLQVGP